MAGRAGRLDDEGNVCDTERTWESGALDGVCAGGFELLGTMEDGGAVFGGTAGGTEDVAGADEDTEAVLWRVDEIVEDRLASERDGPRSAATAADLSMELDGVKHEACPFSDFDCGDSAGGLFALFMNVLNSYFAKRSVNKIAPVGRVVNFTSNIFLELTIPFLVYEVRRWGEARFVRVVLGIRLDIANLLHSLPGRKEKDDVNMGDRNLQKDRMPTSTWSLVHVSRVTLFLTSWVSAAPAAGVP